MNGTFFINSILLGLGLAMDAFSVSCANALREPDMKPGRIAGMAGVYAAFQFLMPMAGWVCMHSIRERFIWFQPFIPWIALALLSWIGINMMIEGFRKRGGGGPASFEFASSEPASSEPASSGSAASKLTFGVIFAQGVATSIDALSVGFTTAEYDMTKAISSSLIIGAVTFVVCLGGLCIGKMAGRRLTGKADILGGAILTAIGLEILITHLI